MVYNSSKRTGVFEDEGGRAAVTSKTTRASETAGFFGCVFFVQLLHTHLYCIVHDGRF